MQTPNSELEASLLLSRCRGIGPVSAKQAIQFFGSARSIFQQKGINLKQHLGFTELQIDQIKRAIELYGHSVYQDVQCLEKTQSRLVRFDDADYPIRLKQIVDAPFVLYVKGKVDLNPPKTIAVVGTRKPNSHSIYLTQQLIESAQQIGVQVISGMAYGIDIVAHRSAIKHRLSTIGILAHGLEQLYPTAHQHTADQLLENGGLITEMPFNTSLHPDLFPRRNRIIAGMSDAIVVVESKLIGGSMSTAQIGRSYDREVFAFPGNPAQGHNTGCNALIKRNIASLIEHFDDICKSMNWFASDSLKPSQIELFPLLSDDEKNILQLLTGRRLHIDELIQYSGIALHRITLSVLELELKGAIKVLPGKYYQRVA